MTKVKWLIEPEIFGDDAQSLLDALEKMGVEHQVWPFGHMYQDFKNKFKDDCVVFYGSFQFADVVRKQTPWIPGLYCNLPKFDCLYYYPRLENYLLNWDYIMLPLGAVGSLSKARFLDQFTFFNKLFIRPSSGSKSFTGKLIERANLDKELKQFALRADPETLVVISKPRNIKREWRLVVAEGSIITGSQYKEGDKMIRSDKVPLEVLQYAQNVLDNVKYKPDPIWTLDICETYEELHVLEVGSFSCAGLYACDAEIIVNTVNRIALEEYLDYQDPRGL
jgi:hypothetical protein